ncbi:uncharacterized protein LOC123314973 [Coccinella septempunctata]|uniref:uncharacterized protein LOC123314973 n=1 Tax=Coccinella septempunctata TaxID=41139 RepID=UPI001D07C71A|nr:uncharacterized protein LOC123314973 [Coccinella septempunctata]
MSYLKTEISLTTYLILRTIRYTMEAANRMGLVLLPISLLGNRLWMTMMLNLIRLPSRALQPVIKAPFKAGRFVVSVPGKIVGGILHVPKNIIASPFRLIKFGLSLPFKFVGLIFKIITFVPRTILETVF